MYIYNQKPDGNPDAARVSDLNGSLPQPRLLETPMPIPCVADRWNRGTRASSASNDESRDIA